MTDELEAPHSAEELYLARGEEVSEARPLLTGDVLEGVHIPGLEGSGHALILEHPCSMRRGPDLVPRILVAHVEVSQPLPLHRWTTGHFRQMPLPELPGLPSAAARFDEIGGVSSRDLPAARRTASLSRRGINLLQQRFIWHLTRFVVPTHLLDLAASGVFEEVDLAEEWIVEALECGESAEEAFRSFHDWIREPDDTGTSRQDQLADAQHISLVRRELRAELRRRYG